MLYRWKAAVVAGLFVLGAVCFLLGLFPALAGLFWTLWLSGCGACIAGLILAVTIPSREAGRRTPEERADALSR